MNAVGDIYYRNFTTLYFKSDMNKDTFLRVARPGIHPPGCALGDFFVRLSATRITNFSLRDLDRTKLANQKEMPYECSATFGRVAEPTG
jgi:hypothetical protein